MTNKLKKALIDFEETLDNTSGLTPIQVINIQASVMKIADVIEKELKDKEKYEVIEEELGIDLLNFSKILFALDSETVYVKEMIYKQYDGYGCFEETGKVERRCIVRFSRAINGNRDWFFIINFGYNPNEYLYRLQDYGKTWVLTKEELEK